MQPYELPSETAIFPLPVEAYKAGKHYTISVLDEWPDSFFFNLVTREEDYAIDLVNYVWENELEEAETYIDVLIITYDDLLKLYIKQSLHLVIKLDGPPDKPDSSDPASMKVIKRFKDFISEIEDDLSA